MSIVRDGTLNTCAFNSWRCLPHIYIYIFSTLVGLCPRFCRVHSQWIGWCFTFFAFLDFLGNDFHSEWWGLKRAQDCFSAPMSGIQFEYSFQGEQKICKHTGLYVVQQISISVNWNQNFEGPFSMMVGVLPGFCWHNPVNNLFLCLEAGVVYPGQYLAELKGMQNMLRSNNAIYFENITKRVHPILFQNLSPNCFHLANIIFRLSSCKGFLWFPVQHWSPALFIWLSYPQLDLKTRLQLC